MRDAEIALSLIVVLAAGGPQLHAQTREPSTSVRLVTVTYPNGRVTREPVRDRDWNVWTPLVPRIDGTKTVDHGLPLTALQLEYAIDGPGLTVTVALLYGTPHQTRVAVARVRLVDERPVRVEELTAFGVRPIALALASTPRPQLSLPAVVTPSSQLEMVAGVPAGGTPRYEISITNHAQQSVMALAFEAYRGQAKVLSGIPHAPRHAPLILPGETYVLPLTASPNGRSGEPVNRWSALDRVVVTSVTWSDGIVEGNVRPAIERHVVNDATARQLARVLTLMRGRQAARVLDLTKLRAAIAALPIDDQDAVRVAAGDPAHLDPAAATSLTQIGMRNAKDTVLDDLDAFLRDAASGDPRAQRAWLALAVAKCEGWRSRIVSAPR